MKCFCIKQYDITDCGLPVLQPSANKMVIKYGSSGVMVG